MSEYSNISRSSVRNRSNIGNNFNNLNDNYERLDISESDRTRDEYMEAIENDKKIKEEYNKTNLFKSRIIGFNKYFYFL